MSKSTRTRSSLRAHVLNTENGHGLADTLIFVSVLMGALALFLPEYFPPQHQVSRGQQKQIHSDLMQLQAAIRKMETDTGRLLGLPGPNPCVNAPEFFLDESCDQGLYCQDGRYPNWQGPYLQRALVDPWGQPYFIDNDFRVKDRLQRVAGSMGPNGIQDPSGGGDDIFIVLCERGG